MNIPMAWQRGGRQRGVVLVVSLMMLLVLTLIGLAATRGTALEQRMTANQNDREVAFEAAEAALRFGEGTLNAATQPNYALNTNGAYFKQTMVTTGANAQVWWNSTFWNTAGNMATYSGGILPAPASPPLYYVVQSTAATADNGQGYGQSRAQGAHENFQSVYYVYARGVGVTGNTSVILQSVYRQ